MFRTLSTLFALVATATPVAAQTAPGMSYPISLSTPTPTPGTCNTANETYETVGNGYTAVTSSSTSNLDGAAVGLGTTSVEMNGFWLYAVGAAASVRGLLDIQIGSFPATTIIEDFAVNNLNGQKLFFPINIPAGSPVSAKWRAATGNSVVNVMVVARIRGAGCDAGWNGAENVSADTAQSRAGTVEVPYGNTWVDLMNGSTTGRSYQAFAVSVGSGTTTPTAAGSSSWQFGKGASGSEVYVGGGGMTFGTTSLGTSGFGGAFFSGPSPSGTRIVGRVNGATTDGTTRFQVLGVY